MVNRSPFYPLFDPATKWLGQGKPFEYAQQNVNLRRVARRPQGFGGQSPPDPPCMSREAARPWDRYDPIAGRAEASRFIEPDQEDHPDVRRPEARIRPA